MYARANTLALQSIVFIYQWMGSTAMIVTHEEDKVAGRAFILGPRSQLWRRAHLELAVPYFLLNYEVAQSGGWIGQTELFWEVDQLLYCCRQIANDDKLRLAQIALISPGWMNREDGWQMHTVHEIWRTHGQDRHPAVTYYVTDTGQRYMDHIDVDIDVEVPAIKLLQVADGDVSLLHTP